MVHNGILWFLSCSFMVETIAFDILKYRKLNGQKSFRLHLYMWCWILHPLSTFGAEYGYIMFVILLFGLLSEGQIDLSEMWYKDKRHCIDHWYYMLYYPTFNKQRSRHSNRIIWKSIDILSQYYNRFYLLCLFG